MTTRKPSSLPDITDEDFRRRLDPLAQAVVPGAATTARAAMTSNGGGEATSASLTGHPDTRISDSYDQPPKPASSGLAARIEAVTQMEEIRAARGPKKGVEFLLPERIVTALKVAAARDSTSMTIKVLEALRLAGYPVEDNDFVDLRKLPKR